MTEKLSMQAIILKLQQYWSAQGCMLMQAYDTEKGAGTMSPYTFYGRSVQNPGTPLTLNLPGVQPMAVTGKTRTGYTNITNSK